MELTQQQYEQLKDVLPRQRGNVEVDNRRVLSALLYVVKQGCKWRAGAVRPVADALYAHESVGEERESNIAEDASA